MSAQKDIQQLVRKLVRQGWAAVIAKSGHWRLTAPSGEQMTCASSPKGDRALKNARSDARRLGARI
jgi:hypothetical protein